jgi:hypothetical protein
MRRGITPAGTLSTRVQSRALTSSDGVGFLKHLHHHVGKKLLVSWEGCPIHRQEVTTFMAQGAAQYLDLHRTSTRLRVSGII